MSQCYTEKTTKSQYYTASGIAARISSAHAHIGLCMLTVTDSEVVILNILKPPWDAQGNGRFTTVSQGHILTLDGS